MDYEKKAILRRLRYAGAALKMNTFYYYTLYELVKVPKTCSWTGPKIGTYNISLQSTLGNILVLLIVLFMEYIIETSIFDWKSQNLTFLA